MKASLRRIGGTRLRKEGGGVLVGVSEGLRGKKKTILITATVRVSSSGGQDRSKEILPPRKVVRGCNLRSETDVTKRARKRVGGGEDGNLRGGEVDDGPLKSMVPTQQREEPRAAIWGKGIAKETIPQRQQALNRKAERGDIALYLTRRGFLADT